MDVTAGSGADTVNIEGLDSQFSADLTVTGDSDAGELDTVTFQTNATAIGDNSLSVTAQTVNVNAALTAGGDISLTAVGGDGADVTIAAAINKTSGADATLTAPLTAMLFALAGSSVLNAYEMIPAIISSRGSRSRTSADTSPSPLDSTASVGIGNVG